MSDTNRHSDGTRAFDNVVAQLNAANVNDCEPVSWPDWDAILDVVRADPTVVVQLIEPLDRIVSRVVAEPTLPAFSDVMSMRRDVFDALLEGTGDRGFEVTLRVGASAPRLQRHVFGDHRHRQAADLVSRYPTDLLTSVLQLQPRDVDPAFLLLIAHELVVKGQPVPAECERLRELVDAYPVGLSALPLQLTRLEKEAARMSEYASMHRPVTETLRAELLTGMTISAERRELIASLVSEDEDFVEYNGRFAVVAHDLRPIATVRDSAPASAQTGGRPPSPTLTGATGIRRLSPGTAFRRLRDIAICPGAYSGWSASKARLAVWRMLAGIVALPWPTPIEAIEEECARTEWFDVAVADSWFSGLKLWQDWLMARRQNELIGLATTSLD